MNHNPTWGPLTECEGVEYVTLKVFESTVSQINSKSNSKCIWVFLVEVTHMSSCHFPVAYKLTYFALHIPFWHITLWNAAWIALDQFEEYWMLQTVQFKCIFIAICFYTNVMFTFGQHILIFSHWQSSACNFQLSIATY